MRAVKTLFPLVAALLAAFPATASAKFHLDLDNVMYSVSTTTVVAQGNYPGDPGPASYHWEYIPHTWDYNRQCSVQNWSSPARTPERHILSLDPVVVRDEISGLLPGHGGDRSNAVNPSDPPKGYCVRFVASLDDGSATDRTPGFFIVPGAPAIDLAIREQVRVRALSPSELSGTVGLNAASQDTSYTLTALPSGQAPCGFSQGSNSAVEKRGTLPGTDGAFHSITETLTADFVRGRQYQVCMPVSNATDSGLAIAPRQITFGEPYLPLDGTTSSITTTSATLSLQASGSGAPTTTEFTIRKKPDCSSGGRTIAGNPLPADYDVHTVKATVTGLDPNTAYCWIANATNDVATVTSGDRGFSEEFKTLPTPAGSVSAPLSAGSVAATPSGVVVVPVVAGCGKGPCTYTSTATAAGGASAAAAQAAKAKRVVVAAGKLKLSTGKESLIKLKLTPAGKKLLKRKKTLAVTVAVKGRDGAGRKSSKTVRAKFKAPHAH